MPSKKGTTKKSKQRTTTARKGRIWHGEESSNSGYMLAKDYDLSLSSSSNGNARKQPHRINPETDEQRDKRLAARKALTLKAARIAYENHHRRKAS